MPTPLRRPARRRSLPFLLPSLLALTLAAAPASKPAKPARPLTARENFEKHCTDCHGEDGKSRTRLGRKSGAKDLTDKPAMAKRTDEDLFKTIKFGRKDKNGDEKMDAFGDGLSDEEIRELVAYVRALAK